MLILVGVRVFMRELGFRRITVITIGRFFLPFLFFEDAISRISSLAALKNRVITGLVFLSL